MGWALQVNSYNTNIVKSVKMPWHHNFGQSWRQSLGQWWGWSQGQLWCQFGVSRWVSHGVDHEVGHMVGHGVSHEVSNMVSHLSMMRPIKGVWSWGQWWGQSWGQSCGLSWHGVGLRSVIRSISPCHEVSEVPKDTLCIEIGETNFLDVGVGDTSHHCILIS